MAGAGRCGMPCCREIEAAYAGGSCAPRLLQCLVGRIPQGLRGGSIMGARWHLPSRYSPPCHACVQHNAVRVNLDVPSPSSRARRRYVRACVCGVPADNATMFRRAQSRYAKRHGIFSDVTPIRRGDACHVSPHVRYVFKRAMFLPRRLPGVLQPGALKPEGAAAACRQNCLSPAT